MPTASSKVGCTMEDIPAIAILQLKYKMDFINIYFINEKTYFPISITVNYVIIK